MNEHLLEIENLRVSYQIYAGVVQSVRGISFSLDPGEILAIVGESGCGKSVTAKSIMRLIHAPGAIMPGSHIYYQGEDVLAFDEKRLSEFRGGECSIIFQDALTSLNPTMTVGRQIMENIRHHRSVDRKEAREEALNLLRKVGISEPERRFRQYPHELSGGMRQRVMIAIAFANRPRILIADEPTTALDVTIQAQIIDLIKKMAREDGTAVILITHDMGVVANVAERILIMYAGKVVEQGKADDVFYATAHPYTALLLSSVPRLDLDSGEELTAIRGTPPDLIHPPEGCAFCTRCDRTMEVCLREEPQMLPLGDGHEAACFLMNLESPFHPEAPARMKAP